MLDRASLLIISVGFVLMLAGLSFIAYQTVQVARIAQRSEEQHQNFLRNQATILRDNDRMMHDHDTATQEHRAILQRLAR